MISFKSSFENTIAVVPASACSACSACIRIATSVVGAIDVTPKGTKTLLANGLSTFPIKSRSVFSNGPRSLLTVQEDYRSS